MCWHSFPLIAYRKGSKHRLRDHPHNSHLHTFTLSITACVCVFVCVSLAERTLKPGRSFKSWRDCIKWATYSQNLHISPREFIWILKLSAWSPPEMCTINICTEFFDWFFNLVFCNMRIYIYMNIHGMSKWKVLLYLSLSQWLFSVSLPPSVCSLHEKLQFNFVLGKLHSIKKMHTVSFTVCLHSLCFFFSFFSFVLLNESTQFQELSFSVLR